MMFPIDTIPVPSTHLVHRPHGGIDGLRQIHDPAGRLAVTAFPIVMAEQLAGACDLRSACYVVAGRGQAFIGESNRAVECVAKYASDPAKTFATEAYLLHERAPHSLDWSARLHLAHRLTKIAEQTGLITLVNTVEPKVRALPAEYAATLERLVTEARRLLFDAGCRTFNGNGAGWLSAEVENGNDKGLDEAAVDRLVALTVETELEFDYCSIRARGHHSPVGFVVARGSEVRNVEMPSLRKNIKALRADLRAKGIVTPIVGVKDRLRFETAWPFPTAAVAAKFVAGAHVAATKWVRPRSSTQIARSE